MFIRLVASRHKLKIKFLFKTGSFFFLHRRWHIEGDTVEWLWNRTRSRATKCDTFPRSVFPSRFSRLCASTMCWSFSINIYTTFFPRETPRLGLSRFKLPNCDGTLPVTPLPPPLMELTMTPMTLTLSLTPWLYWWYWPWQGCAINAEDAVIFHRLVWDSKYWSNFWRDVYAL